MARAGSALLCLALLLAGGCSALDLGGTASRQLLVQPRHREGRRPHNAQVGSGQQQGGGQAGDAAAAAAAQQGSDGAGQQAGGLPLDWSVSGWDGQPSWEWDNPRTLYFEPVAGLGNRLRALASAVVVAREAGVGLKVVWREEVECGPDCGHMPPFNSTWLDLFSEPRLRLAPNFPGSNYSVHDENTWLKKDSHILHPGMPPVIAGFNCNVHTAHNHSHLHSLIAHNFTHVAGEQVLCVKSDLWLTRNGEGDGRFFFRLLKPSPPVQQMLDAFKRRVAWPEFHVIGVHIRRTDLALTAVDGRKARMDSLLSLSRYVDKMRKLTQLAHTAEGTRYFLATDDAEAEKIVKSSFEPDVVWSYPKTVWKRSSVAGIQQALVDVLLLAECPVLIGTYYSSYSETAKMVGWPYYIQLGGEFNSLSKETSFDAAQ